LARFGIDPDRVTMRGRETIDDYYRAIANVDIALDTFPYNGATTTFDVLWMGVPIVALRGTRTLARSGCSILSTLGMPELVAASTDAYVELNVRLAHDDGWRATLRKTLRRRLEASPLMDAARFTTGLETAYRAMWRTWCGGQN